MINFFNTLFLSHMSFFLYALLISIFASPIFGTIGTFIVIRRISYMAGAISHCILGGIGLGIYLNKVHQIYWITPFSGAIITAILSAIIISIFNIYYKEREETLIGALWSLGMGLGLIFIHLTPSNIDITSYLFGSIIMASKEDFFTVLALNLLVISIISLFYHKFIAICFDEEFAKLRGINVNFYNLLLLILIAISIVFLINIVGIIMIIALLTIPAAIANRFSTKIWQMILFSTIICSIFTTLGLVLSFYFDIPSGPTIIVLSAISYFASTILSAFPKKTIN